jgi:hypothetical protein
LATVVGVWLGLSAPDTSPVTPTTGTPPAAAPAVVASQTP